MGKKKGDIIKHSKYVGHPIKSMVEKKKSSDGKKKKTIKDKFDEELDRTKQIWTRVSENITFYKSITSMHLHLIYFKKKTTKQWN